MPILEEFYGRNTQPGHDKEYRLFLEQLPNGDYKTHGLYGKTGACHQQTLKYTGPNYGQAKRYFDDLVAEKQGKMYVGQVTTNRGINQSVVAGVNQQVQKPASVPVTPTKQRSKHTPHLLTPVDAETAAQLRTDNIHWMMQKFDGDRRAIELRGGVPFGINRKGEYVSLPPEVESACSALPFQDGLVDGEIVGSKFYAFDLLELGGNDLRASGFEYRYDELERQFEKMSSTPEPLLLGPVAKTPEDKEYFHTVLEEANAEGEVFKLKTAPYTNAARNDTQFKFKYWKSATVMVYQVNQKRSVVMAVFEDGSDAPILIGNCTIKPNAQIPEVGDLIEVKYLYWDINSLIQPEFLRLRTDLDDTTASVSQLVRRAGLST